MSLTRKKQAPVKNLNDVAKEQEAKNKPFDIKISWEKILAWDQYADKNIPQHWAKEFAMFLNGCERTERK